ncbi:hypothetical protein PENTCL1PPCAC_3545, partial [Pristionchus entomophagus]
LMRSSSKVYEMPRVDSAQPGCCNTVGPKINLLTVSISSSWDMCGERPPCMQNIFVATSAAHGIQLKTFTNPQYLHSSIDVIAEKEVRLADRVAALGQHHAQLAKLA